MKQYIGKILQEGEDGIELSLKFGTNEMEIQSALQIGPRQMVIEILRIIRRRDVPVALDVKYIPYDKGYSSSMGTTSAYLSSTSYTSLPIVFELGFNASTTEPFIWERDSALRYAQQNWGTDFSTDTVGMFRHMVKTNPEGNEITADSTVSVYYEEYFMDGFLASTNIDTVAAKWNVYDSSGETSYDPMVVQPASGANYSEHKAIFIAVEHMRKGEVADIVTVSSWAQGDSGNTNQTPEVLPYQPMRYRIYIVDDTQEDEEEGSEDLTE